MLFACRLWGKLWKGKTVSIACDNRSAVDIMNFGGTRDSSLAAIARNIWLEMASLDFTLTIVHIPGKLNTTADLLSRWEKTVFNDEKLKKLVPHPIWWEPEEACLSIDTNI